MDNSFIYIKPEESGLSVTVRIPKGKGAQAQKKQLLNRIIASKTCMTGGYQQFDPDRPFVFTFTQYIPTQQQKKRSQTIRKQIQQRNEYGR
jgi:hypothetical protein